MATEEHLADQDTLHIGPVRSARRLAALFHTHAQDPQGSGKLEVSLFHELEGYGGQYYEGRRKRQFKWNLGSLLIGM